MHAGLDPAESPELLTDQYAVSHLLLISLATGRVVDSVEVLLSLTHLKNFSAGLSVWLYRYTLAVLSPVMQNIHLLRISAEEGGRGQEGRGARLVECCNPISYFLSYPDYELLLSHPSHASAAALGQHVCRVQADMGRATRVTRVRQEQLVVRVAEEVADRIAALHQTGTPAFLTPSLLLGGYTQQVYVLHHGREHSQCVPVQPHTQACTEVLQVSQTQQHLHAIHDPASRQTDEQQVRDRVLVSQQHRALRRVQTRVQVRLACEQTVRTVGRREGWERLECLSVGSDQEARVAGEEEAVVGTEGDGGIWRRDLVLEVEDLAEDVSSRGVSDLVSRDASIAVDGESVPVVSKRDQLCTVWSELVHVFSLSGDRVNGFMRNNTLV